MNLYKCKNNTKVRVLGDIMVPWGAPPINVGDILEFRHIDGMYSLCYKDGKIVHLAAWAEVEYVT